MPQTTTLNGHAESVFAPRLGDEGDACASCGALLAPDQRYCLSCGQRRAGTRVPFPAPAVAAPAPPPPVRPLPRRGSGIPPWAGIAAVAALGFGMLVGVLFANANDDPPAPQVITQAPTATATAADADRGPDERAGRDTDRRADRRGDDVHPRLAVRDQRLDGPAADAAQGRDDARPGQRRQVRRDRQGRGGRRRARLGLLPHARRRQLRHLLGRRHEQGRRADRARRPEGQLPGREGRRGLRTPSRPPRRRSARPTRRRRSCATRRTKVKPKGTPPPTDDKKPGGDDPSGGGATEIG